MAAPGLGDIVKALQIIEFLRSHCFDSVNSASARWREFADDVYGLETQLLALREHLSEAAQLVGAAVNLTEAENIIGKFLDTLEKCRALIEKKRIVVVRHKGIITNIRWTLGVQNTIEHFRRQIRLHSHKILLLLKPIDGQMLREILGHVQEIVVSLREFDANRVAVQQTLSIPPMLHLVFERNSTNIPGQRLDSFDSVSIPEAYDLLFGHFRASFCPGGAHDPSLTQYCHLLRCQWIISSLRSRPAIHRPSPGALFALLISNMQQNIFRVPAEPVPQDRLVQLSEDAGHKDLFLIWPVSEPTPPETPPWLRDTLEDDFGRGGFKRIVPNISLVIKGAVQDVAIFRHEVHPAKLRVVPIISDATKATDLGGLPLNLNTRCDRFNPSYAVRGDASAEPPCIRVVVVDGGGRSAADYVFTHAREAWDFQRAVTGYRVAGEWSSVRFRLHRMLGSTRFAHGLVQIWQWDPFPEPRPAEGGRGSGSGLTRQTTGGSTSTGTTSRFEYLRDKQLLHEVQQRTGVTSWAYEDAPRPCITVFQQEGNKYKLLQVPVIEDLNINSSSCRCSTDESGCSVIIVECDRMKRFAVNQIKDEETRDNGKESRFDDWNLALLAGRSDYLPDDTGKAKTQDYRYLQLEFEDVEPRRNFEQHLKAVKEEHNTTQGYVRAFQEDVHVQNCRARPGPQ